MARTRRQVLAAAAGTVPLSLAGCTSGGGGDQSPTETATETPTGTRGGTGGESVGKTIRMVNTSFDPLKAEVETGTTVKWVNEDAYRHDVTAAQFHDSAAAWSFSETLSGGQSTTYTFEREGVYEYYCTIHGKSTMCGAVLVGGATLGKSLPCSGGMTY